MVRTECKIQRTSNTVILLKLLGRCVCVKYETDRFSSVLGHVDVLLTDNRFDPVGILNEKLATVLSLVLTYLLHGAESLRISPVFS